MNVCAECGKSFESTSGLHKHIKAHKFSLQDYYQKHHPKYDLFSGEILPFKNLDQYARQDFANVGNQYLWAEKASDKEVRKLLVRQISLEIDKRHFKIGPASLFFRLAKMPELKFVRRAFKSYGHFCDIMGLKYLYNKNLPKEFWAHELGEMQIIQDTREQKPIEFPNQIISKLDFGDYTAAGEFYDKTFVERKSVADFVGTFGSGYERFEKEIQRAKAFSSFVFVLVEGVLEDLEKFAKEQKGKPNLDYVCHNLKNCLTDYPDSCQIVFGYNRAGVRKLIPKILKSGRSIWNVDLNYFIEQKIHGLD
jgi:hypothetical protein